MNESVNMTPRQLMELLRMTIPAGLSVLITGEPGVGKTQIVEQVCKELSVDFLLSHPAVEDPTVPAGLPMAHPGDTEAKFLPFGILAQAKRATKRTAWVWDDFGQSMPATQAAYMQLLEAGQCGEHKLPNVITIIAITNGRGHRAGVSGILEPVKSRFYCIVNLVADLDDWCTWAYTAGIEPMRIAFLRYRPELLCKFEPTADLVNSPSPRTHFKADRLEKLHLSPAVEAIAQAGATGEACALEYLAFRQMANSLVNLDAILLDPDHAPIPSKPSELYATAVGLAGRANSTNFARIATYATRLAVEANHGEFAVMMVRDAQRRDSKITYTDSFVRLASGPIGKLFSGQE